MWPCASGWWRRWALSCAGDPACLQAVCEKRTLPYMRLAPIVSARVVASAGAAGLGFESRSFGGSGAAVLLEQRSGAPMRLSDGTRLPREGQRALVVPAAAGRQLAFAPAAGGAEVVVTLFPDGAPPIRN